MKGSKEALWKAAKDKMQSQCREQETPEELIKGCASDPAKS